MKVDTKVALALTLVALAAGPGRAQTFDSGSDGSDGALAFPPGVTVDFDPAAFTPALDPDGDYVFHFTTITIPATTTVRLRTRVFTKEGRPIVWLASGAVVIDGVLDLDGDDGHAWNAPRAPAFAGAGGWNGGEGATLSLLTPTAGNGPGGGLPDDANHGGPGSHGLAGATTTGPAGAVYGNIYLRPHTGGSGGAGGRVNGTNNGNGGGGGGGAILIASSTSIRLGGAVRAMGGDGATGSGHAGGGGSGGGVRLVAPTLEGAGTVDVRGGAGASGSNVGGHGRVRLEAFRFPSQPDVTPPGALTRAAPSAVFLPATAPALRVARVAGQDVATSPTGSFELPDVAIDAAGAVTLELETRGVPAGTTLSLTLQPENGTQVTTTSSPVVVTDGVGAATATATFPAGHTRVFVRATWTP